MKTSFKRLGALLLSVLMLVTMFPAFELSASAAGTLSVTDANIGLAYSDKTDVNGNATTRGQADWSASGDTITCVTKGYTPNKYIYTTLTITNNHTDDRYLMFKYEFTGDGAVSEAITCTNGTSGNYNEVLAAGASVSIKIQSPKGTKTNTLILNNIMLVSAGDIESTFLAPENGSYTVDNTEITAETKLEKKATESYALIATPAEGYIFYGWYSATADAYVSYESETTLNFSADPQLKPVFLADTTAIFSVDNANFDNLTEAANFAVTSMSKLIVLKNSGTVTGEHTIPEGVTLLIPYNSANTMYSEQANNLSAACSSTKDNNVAWVQPTAYRTLTLAADAKIIVNGTVNVSGQHAASNGSGAYCAAPTGPLGWINMLDGAEIVLNDGAYLYAWGYIQGAGAVTANSGSTVYENFQFTDFRGGSNTLSLAGTMLVFPINQYYIQNIEVPVTFYGGSKEVVYTSGYASAQVLGGAATFIGEGGMFVAEDDSRIVKDYIENTDRLQVDVYGDAKMSSMTVNVGAEVNSSDFMLPITNNVTINLHSGTTELEQSVALLPGTEMTIDKEATLKIGYQEEPLNDFNGAPGHDFVVYDYDEWTYGYVLNFDPDAEDIFVYDEETGFFKTAEGNFAFPKKRLKPVSYAPGRTYERTEADLKDAVVDVNGTIIAEGYIYTTLGGASDPVIGGGAIKSSEKTGRIEMVNGAGFSYFTFQANDGTPLALPMNTATLLNGDGSYTKTGPDFMDMIFEEDVPVAEPGAVYNYCARHDSWYLGEECERCANAVFYNITWNVNGDELNIELEEGTTPVYPGATPSKALDDNNHYVFAGWSTSENGEVLETIPAVSGEETYYAVFTAVKHDYATTAVEGKHTCTGCTKVASCYDADNDGDHLCDLGCGDEKSEHKGGTATCKVQAVCTECNKAYGETAKHDTVQVGAQDKTCTEAGWAAYEYCKNCDYSTKVEIPASHSLVQAGAQDKTCTEAGWEAYEYCTECDYSTKVEIPAGHNIVKADAKDKTCTEAGWEAYEYCTECDYSTKVEIPASHNIVKVGAQDKTCTEAGWAAYEYCTECDYSTKVEIPASHDGKLAYSPVNHESHIIYYDCCDAEVDWEDHTFVDDECVCGFVVGWYKLENHDWWYYRDKETGDDVKGVNRLPYPRMEIEGVTYAPDADDLAYWESHKLTSSYTDAETALFVFDENGVFDNETGIVEYDGAMRYSANGMIGWHPGLVEVDGEYYYFKGDKNGGGNIMATGDVYATRNTTSSLEIINGGIYTFDDEGKLCKYDGIYDVNGKLRYYKDYRLVTNEPGLVKVGNDYYYVTYNGEVATSTKVWISKDNGLGFNSGFYKFGADGKMILDGIIEIDGSYFYFENGVMHRNTGVEKLTDEEGNTFYIYVRSNGALATGTYWPTRRNDLLERGAYNWGADGKYYPVATDVEDGIVEKDGKYYYYLGGVLQMGTGVQKLTDDNGDTFYIYVRTNGELATGIYWPSVRNNLLDRGAYDWGTDGKYYPGK